MNFLVAAGTWAGVPEFLVTGIDWEGLVVLTVNKVLQKTLPELSPPSVLKPYDLVLRLSHTCGFVAAKVDGVTLL